MRRPNGSGTVYKLKGNRRRPWAAAKNKTVIGYYATKKEALEALESLTGRNIDGNYNMTFAEVWNGWSAEHFRKIESDPALIRRYNNAFEILKPLHKRKFRTLHARDFQQIADSVPKQTHGVLAPVKQIVCMMYEYAIREEIVTVNYGKYIIIPKTPKTEKQIFSDTEIEKISRDGSETAQAVLLLIYTGMRIGELIDLPKSACHETYVIGGEKTEAGRNRTIPVPKIVRPCLRYLLDNSDTDMVVNISRRTFSRKYKALLDKLNIEYKSPHSTRHTFASICRREGVPPEMLQKIMGHADYSTTADIYVHTDTDDLIKAAENLR